MDATSIDWDALAEPFDPKEIEWRVMEAGKSRSGSIWVKAIAYINNRAVMHRLDTTVGPGNWRNEYATGPQGGVICGISIRVDGEWVTKWDGAEGVGEIEPVKAGLSNSMKRAAVQWGIGRYLYDLPDQFADVGDEEADRKKFPNWGRLPRDKGGDVFRWATPNLPEEYKPKALQKKPPASGAEQPGKKPEGKPPGDPPKEKAKKPFTLEIALEAIGKVTTTQEFQELYPRIEARIEELSADDQAKITDALNDKSGRLNGRIK